MESLIITPPLKDPNSENVVLQLIRQNPGSWKIDLQLFGIFVVKNDLISPYKTPNFQKFPPAAGQILQIVDLQLTRQNNFYQFANLQLTRGGYLFGKGRYECVMQALVPEKVGQ